MTIFCGQAKDIKGYMKALLVIYGEDFKVKDLTPVDRKRECRKEEDSNEKINKD